MKVKTSTLIGPALDWAVATLQNVEVDENFEPIWFDDLGNFASYTPHTDWSQGGPIIEREEIGTYTQYPRAVALSWYGRHKGSILGTGSTPLIAAMRCYVTSKLGDEVDVPDELLET